ncbi:MAG: hypothetical protein WEB07_02370 [Natronospirillum sp.]
MKFTFSKNSLILLSFILVSCVSNAQAQNNSLATLKEEGKEYFSFEYNDRHGNRFENLYSFHDDYFIRQFTDYKARGIVFYKIYYKDILVTDGKPRGVGQDARDADYKVATIPIKHQYMCQSGDCDDGGKYWKTPGSSHGLSFHVSNEEKVMNLIPHIMNVAKERGADPYER